MNIHEYQGKEVLRKYGVATPRGFLCLSVEEAVDAAARLGGTRWVVKAQIHAGGRGKGGGVKLARSMAQVRQHAGDILGMHLKTHQTGPEGRLVRRLLVEEATDIAKEFYLGLAVDRDTQRVALMASSEGGMDIEEVAARTPGKIHKVSIDPIAGLTVGQADDAARRIGIPGKSIPRGARLHAEALPRLRRMRRVAGRDQSAGADRRRPLDRARRQVRLRSERAVSAIRRSSRCAISTRKTRPRSRPRSSTSPTSRWTATSAAWSTVRAWRWRRWT